MATKKGRKTQAQLLNEVEALVRPYRGRGKTKGGKFKPHAKMTGKCKKCGGYHSASAHASHGPGSFARTHGSDEVRLARELHAAGAEDLLVLL